mgnify:CR=1 FL=1
MVLIPVPVCGKGLQLLPKLLQTYSREYCSFDAGCIGRWLVHLCPACIHCCVHSSGPLLVVCPPRA